MYWVIQLCLHSDWGFQLEALGLCQFIQFSRLSIIWKAVVIKKCNHLLYPLFLEEQRVLVGFFKGIPWGNQNYFCLIWVSFQFFKSILTIFSSLSTLGSFYLCIFKQTATLTPSRACFLALCRTMHKYHQPSSLLRMVGQARHALLRQQYWRILWCSSWC